MKYYPLARIFGVFTLLVAETSASNINDDKSNGSPSDSKVTRDSTAPWPCPYYHETTFSGHQSIQYTVYCESLILGSIITAFSQSDIDRWRCMLECDSLAACNVVTLQPGRCTLHSQSPGPTVPSNGNIVAIKISRGFSPIPTFVFEPTTVPDPPATTMATTTVPSDQAAPPPRAPTNIRYGNDYDTGGIWGRAFEERVIEQLADLSH
jgi:hypothetical protein